MGCLILFVFHQWFKQQEGERADMGSLIGYSKGYFWWEMLNYDWLYRNPFIFYGFCQDYCNLHIFAICLFRSIRFKSQL